MDARWGARVDVCPPPPPLESEFFFCNMREGAFCYFLSIYGPFCYAFLLMKSSFYHVGTFKLPTFFLHVWGLFVLMGLFGARPRPKPPPPPHPPPTLRFFLREPILYTLQIRHYTWDKLMGQLLVVIDLMITIDNDYYLKTSDYFGNLW